MKMILPEIERLMKLNPTPRVHGNGFIQLDITDTKRINIWHPDLPRQKIATPIHSHRFGFTSTVLLGRLVNITYNVWPYSEQGNYITHNIYECHASSNNETILVPSPKYLFARVEPVWTQLIRQSESYQFPPTAFHESAPLEWAATYMVKTLALPDYTPRVLVPLGEPPDNDYARNMVDSVAIWNIVRRTLRRING
jgi:hypothetical protein